MAVVTQGAPDAGPRPGTKGERTRRRILDTAGKLFADHGFNGVSLRDVAAAAGITHAGLLHYFGGKGDLLVQVMIDRDDAEIAALRRLRQLLTERDGREYGVDEIALPWLIHEISRNQQHDDLAPLYMRMSAEASEPGHLARTYFVERYARLRRTLESAFALELTRRAPGVAAFDPAAAARDIIALADGLQLQWVLEPGEIDMVAGLLGYLDTLGIDHTAWPDLTALRDADTGE